MTLTHLAKGLPEIRVDGDVVHIRDLVVPHPEAAGLLRAQLNDAGPEVAADIVRRALPIGLVALNLSSSAVDSGAIARTLSGFADLIDSRATAAIHELETAMGRVRQQEQGIAETARLVLGGLPKQVDAALAGQSDSVRSAVVEAARSVQDSGLQQLTAALGQHSAAIQKELSLDREGPLRSLRQDLLNQLDGARRELSTQLTEVRALVEAAQAAKVAGAKSSRAVGADIERDLMALCNEVVTAAGDLFEETGNQAGVNGRRTGDGVATLSELVSGPGRRVRIALEAKSRSRPMSVKALRQEAANACATREADGVLIVVPTRAEVPGQASLCRLDTTAYVVSAEDGGEVTSWSYLVLREQVALLARRNTADTTVDLSVVEARITAALTSIGELDEVGKYANLARQNLDKLIVSGRGTQQRVRDALTDVLAALRA
ncbi:hypothetical protein [Nocardioides sp. Arc9.136]|uniref:hypothetical protein n=1 Tax=Nocardioides sp. Arc9.136 TaxID=2996826 RepID=UPI00266699FD|nr:hypothetical protein [Nocardioides sp. Arc9.136]WKN47461.1 hypothetical protein OSR43_15645 [Nocardioides sp. Arc9.136]